METKICNKCNVEKKLEEFYKDSSKKCGYRYCCKSCAIILSSNFQKRKGSNYKKDINLKSLYGISLDDYEKMLIEQKGLCKICNSNQSSLKRGLAVDHCHINGTIRGLLCHSCNTALGSFKDSVELLEKAINYLNASIDDNILT